MPNSTYALTITQQYPAERFNLLVPMQTVAEIAEIQRPVMNCVTISTNVNDKEVYLQDKTNGGFALTKKGLTKLMRAAGIKVLETQSVLPSVCQKCASMNRAIGTPVNCSRCGNKDVRYEAKISVPQLTGENLILVAHKEINIEEATAGMSLKQKSEFMKFRNEMCETKAINRALRAALHIKGTYTAQELQKPFVVAYLVPNLDNPEVREEAIKSMFSATDKLFPNNELESNAEAPQALPQAQPQLPQPEQNVDEIVPDDDFPEPPPYGYPPEEPPAYSQEGYYATPSQPQPQRSAAQTCSACGAKISDKVLDYSVNRFGRALCMNCQRNQGGAR